MKPRILVADDDADLREILHLALVRDYDVIEAADGDQAVARAIDSDPSLILLDVRMPGTDGFDVCRRLKSDRRTLGVPIIIMSGQGDRRARADVLQIGAEDYLYKPLHLRSLRERVRTMIQMRDINALFNAGASPH